jgi:hypothetical protein
MILSAEQCLKKATFYEKVAEHESAPWVQRVEFARKANTFRILARLAGDAGGGNGFAASRQKTTATDCGLRSVTARK